MILAALLFLACAQPEPLVLAPSGEFSLIGGEAQGIDFDAAGTRMLTHGWFGDVILWDLKSLEVIGRVSFPGEDVGTVALHPSELIAAIGVCPPRTPPPRPEEARIVDLRTGRVLARYEADGGFAGVPELAVYASRLRTWRGVAQDHGGLRGLPGPARLAPAKWRWIAHAPGGGTAVIADDAGRLHVCQAGGTRVVVEHLGHVEALAFTPDGRHVAGCSSGAVTFATSAGVIVRRVPAVATVATGIEGSDIWVIDAQEASRFDAVDVRVHETWTTLPPQRVDLEPRIDSLRYGLGPRARPCWGRALALVGGLAVRVQTGARPALWSADGLEATPMTMPGVGNHWCQHLVRSRDGRRWAALWWCDDPRLDGFRTVEPSGVVGAFTAGGRQTLDLAVRGVPTAAAFSPDGAVLALGVRPTWRYPPEPDQGEPRIELRDARSGEIRRQATNRGPVGWLGYPDADTLLALSGSNLEVLDATTLALRQTIDLHGEIDAVDLSLDGSRLAIARGPRVYVYALTR